MRHPIEAMNRYSVRATYATPTGRQGRTTFDLFAPSMVVATVKAHAKLKRPGRSKMDVHIVRLGPVDARNYRL